MSAWLLFPEASLPNAPTASHTFSSEGMSYKDTSHKPQGVMPTASRHSIISSKSPDPEGPVSPQPLQHRTLERAQFGPEHPVVSSSEYTGRNCQNVPPSLKGMWASVFEH